MRTIAIIMGAAIGATSFADDASACRHFTVWRMSYPQLCDANGVWHGAAPAVAAKVSGPAIQDLAPSPTEEPFVIPPAAATEADERAWGIDQLRKQLSARGM